MTTIQVIDEPENPLQRAALVENGHDFADVTNIVAGVAESKTPKGWYLMFGISVLLLMNLGAMIAYLVWTGVGVWGNNNPVGWGWPIVNFVFWIGIGHAGTLISAILCLFRQKWRTSINRASEAMTIFAVAAAGIFPAIHVGRIWVIYWVFPIPNQMAMWPNFKSPLLWDVFAVSTYLDGLRAVLVRRPDPGHRDASATAPQGRPQDLELRPTACSRSVGTAATVTGSTTRRPT